jgi:hypothetical protein
MGIYGAEMGILEIFGLWNIVWKEETTRNERFLSKIWEFTVAFFWIRHRVMLGFWHQKLHQSSGWDFQSTKSGTDFGPQKRSKKMSVAGWQRVSTCSCEKKMEDTIIYSIKLDINFINLQTWRWRLTTTWDRAVYSWWGYLTDKLLTFVEHFCLSLRKIKLSIHGLLMPCSAVVGDANIKGNIKGLLSPFCWLYRWLDNPNLNVW